MPLLTVANLRISLATPHGTVDAVRGIDFSLPAGGTLGLIGESGCGKSLTALALMGLLPEGARVSGSIRLAGQELVGLDEPALCQLRGNRIAMVFQEPMAALNPLHRVGDQVAEPLRIHRGLARSQARKEAQALLERVGIADAARRMGGYPHEFSGGQRQRICIAMALACGPELLIADEPTTALDTEVQAQILALLAELVAERGMALLLISHDLAVVAQHTASSNPARRKRSSRAWPTRTRAASWRPARCWAATRAPALRCARPCPPLPAACRRCTRCRRAARLPGAARSLSTPAMWRRHPRWIWATATACAASGQKPWRAMRHERDYS